MRKTINFIGLGAQRTGTSWIYAQLYEHPQLCLPLKEINFFSRERNWKKGIDWYESRFKNCPKNQLKGEFSTSYLPSEITAQRIFQHYPKAKLIACLRNPVQRAFSAYQNDIIGGHLSKGKSFREAISENKEYLTRGFYYQQLKNYLSRFPKHQILILIYEDNKKSPQEFIQKIYRFLGIDDSFVSSMLKKKIGQSRTPRFVFVDRAIFHLASFLRRRGLDKLVWWGKKTGIPEFIRELNTEREKVPKLGEKTRLKLEKIFAKNVAQTAHLLNRDLSQVWFDYQKYLR